MRISEHRYNRDRRIIDVAARLIDFEARTSTIHDLTGLSGDRIRKLSKECGVDGKSTSKQRHRGASPSSVSILLAKPRLKNEADALFSLCRLMGVSPGSGPEHSERRLPDVSRAERLCDAFWTFRYLLPQTSISFEHMLLMLSEAAKDGELVGTHCTDCNALFVVDALSLYDAVCPHCSGVPLRVGKAGRIPLQCVAEEAPAYT